MLKLSGRLAGKNTEFQKDVNRIKTLLYCLGWTDTQIQMLIINAVHKYGQQGVMLLLVLQKAHDYSKDGKTPAEIINMFAPHMKS